MKRETFSGGLTAGRPPPQGCTLIHCMSAHCCAPGPHRPIKPACDACTQNPASRVPRRPQCATRARAACTWCLIRSTAPTRSSSTTCASCARTRWGGREAWRAEVAACHRPCCAMQSEPPMPTAHLGAGSAVAELKRGCSLCAGPRCHPQVIPTVGVDGQDGEKERAKMQRHFRLLGGEGGGSRVHKVASRQAACILEAAFWSCCVSILSGFTIDSSLPRPPLQWMRPPARPGSWRA